MTEQEQAADRPRHGVGTIVTHPQFGRGRIVGYEGASYAIAFGGGEVKRVAFFYADLTVLESQGDPDLDRVKQAMREVLGDYGWIDAALEMSSRWHCGTPVMHPGSINTQSKEVPLDMFFKKLIGVREKLRVLEQKINNHKSLSPEEKVDLEGYISRCYGSLTTFNVLFASKEQGFSGTGKKAGGE